MSYDDVGGLILAGGESRRFGSDKARFPVGGTAMIERVFDVVQGVVRPVRISVGMRTQPFALPAEHVRDRSPGAGPLAGLHAGLVRSEKPWMLVVACDLPFVTSGVLREMLDSREEGTDVVVARTHDGQLHPHCACYHRSILGVVERQIDEGRLALHALLDGLASLRAVAVPARPLQNVNYRSDVGEGARHPHHLDTSR